MLDEDDDLRLVLGLLFGLIALVLGLMIGVAGWSLSRAATPAVEAPTPMTALMREAAGTASPTAEISFTDAEPLGNPQLKVYFALGETGLDDAAAADLAAFAKAIPQAGIATILVSGFHDASGSAEVNAEIAKTRAIGVRNALIAAGVSAERVQLSRPAETQGGADAAEARRVELRLQ